MNPSLKIILILIIFILIYLLYKTLFFRGMVYVKSTLDNEYYLVRNYPDKQQSCDTLAKLKKNIFAIVDYVKSTKTKNTENMEQYIYQLCSRIKNVIIKESYPNTNFTSYCVNKGEELVFCIRLTKEGGEIHPINLLMYVVIHEISHVACPEEGHTPLFNKIFKFLCKSSIELGIYSKIDFYKTPLNYCGMIINDSII
jgi:hypothetical protein